MLGFSSSYEFIGYLAVWYIILWLAYKLLKGIYTTFLASSLGKGVEWRPGPNSYAVITGGTDGIGLEYATELAKKGYSLLLISRNPQKLSEVKDKIKARAPKCNDIRTLAIDFSSRDVYEKIKSEVDKLGNVDVLVNNVGISYTYCEYFSLIPEQDQLIESIMNINIYSCVKMCQIVLPKMEAQRRGIIINVSSLSASYPCPLLSLYGASKTFVDFFSQALATEYKGRGIVIQSVLPAYVSTKMSKIRKTSLLVPSASAYVRGALNTVGVEGRTYGYWSHKVQGFVQDNIFTLIPINLNTYIMNKSLQGVRKSYYRKFGLTDPMR